MGVICRDDFIGKVGADLVLAEALVARGQLREAGVGGRNPGLQGAAGLVGGGHVDAGSLAVGAGLPAKRVSPLG